MGLFSKSERPVVGARAWVVPGQTINAGENENNTTHRSEAKTRFFLEVRETADGLPGVPGHQRAYARCPNWLRVVCEFAGTNDEPSDRLPPEVQLPVWIDQASRQIVSVDIERACAELEPYREVGRERWKHTEAPLAGARNVASLPSDAVRFGKGLGRGWRDLVADIKGLGQTGLPDPEVVRNTPRDPVREEQIRRTAQQLRFRLERNPKEWQQHRANVEMSMEINIESARAGRITPGDLEEWIILGHTSGVMSDEEVAHVRQSVAAPLDLDPPSDGLSAG